MGYSLFNLKHFLDMSCIARFKNVNLFDSISHDGRGILKAVDFLVPYVGKPQSAFPYKQIKEWDKTQKELLKTLYRIDNLTKTSKYKYLYSNTLSISEKELNSPIY
jgi:hypothetical protein